MRPISVDQILFWIILAVALTAIGLIFQATKPLRKSLKIHKEKTREHWRALINPLAGGSYWGGRVPGLVWRLLLTLFALFALFNFYNPIWGILLSLWTVTLWWVAIADARTRKDETVRLETPLPTPKQDPD